MFSRDITGVKQIIGDFTYSTDGMREKGYKGSETNIGDFESSTDRIREKGYYGGGEQTSETLNLQRMGYGRRDITGVKK
jgi:hypothetical protein